MNPAKVRAGTPPSVWLLVTLLIAELFYAGIKTGGFTMPIDRLPWGLLVPAMAVFCFVHSCLLLGIVRAVVLLACAAGISFCFEWVGESTGMPFGPYYYTDVLGWKIGGKIPALIPFAWYMMFYPSYVIGNLLGEGGPISQRNPSWVRIIWLSLLSAAVLTAWDLTMDPVMSFADGRNDPAIPDSADVGTPAWVWTQGGAHFGVPFQNYFGWMLTAFTVFVVYRWLETRLPHAQAHGMCSRVMISLPVGAYMIMALVNTWLGYPEIEGLRLISPFSMGIPAFFAAFQLLANRTDLPMWPQEPHDGHAPEQPGTGPVDHARERSA